MATRGPGALPRSGEPTPWVGVALSVTLMVLAMALPRLFSWDVKAFYFPPLTGVWDPRVGPGTLPAIALGALAVRYGFTVAGTTRWPYLLGWVYVADVAWQTSLATVSGMAGIGAVLNDGHEYLQTARATTDISAALHGFIARIPLHSPDHWAAHVAGHPPGALVFFVLLVRWGLGSGLAAGFVILLLAATTPVAVLVTLNRLGAESPARRVAPLLVFGPAAIWTAVSADAMFAACAAWGLCCLAIASTAQRRARVVIWAVVSGLLLGYCVMLSYGLVLLGILAVAVLLAARNARALPWAAMSALAVVLAFATAGFSWWEAFPVVRERYFDGIASSRPAGYWIWADLATLAFSAGPLVGAAIAVSLRSAWTSNDMTDDESNRPVVILTVAAALAIAVADLSLLSKAETERIWLPFVPWLLVGCSMLSRRWRLGGLAMQVTLALLLESLLYTPW
jgi:hypothetical protein